MTNEAYTEIVNRYANCMEEIKLRTNSIGLILSKQKTTGYKYTDTEFVCLQFRKILELIALANLVSNKDEYSKRHANFANHYHAKHIFKDIEKINPDFYPIASDQLIDPITKEVKEVKELDTGYLTKDEFILVYDECSILMHAENPFAMPKDLDSLNLKFRDWLIKIITLLNHHQIQLTDVNKQIWCIMRSKDNEKVQVTLFERIETN